MYITAKDYLWQILSAAFFWVFMICCSTYFLTGIIPGHQTISSFCFLHVTFYRTICKLREACDCLNSHSPPPVSSSGWRSSRLSSSWTAWIYGTESSQFHLPEAANQVHFYVSPINSSTHCFLMLRSLTCLTAMLTLTELMEPSIRTFSLSLRLITTGWRSNSLLLLEMGINTQLTIIYLGSNRCLTLITPARCHVRLTVLLLLACCVSPPLERRNSPGRGRPAEWRALRWDTDATLPSEERNKEMRIIPREE